MTDKTSVYKPWGPQAIKVNEKRYYSKDLGETTPEELCMRLATAIAEPEKEMPGGDFDEARKLFYTMLINRYTMPNTPTWVNAGLPGGRTLSGCFERDIADSMDDITAAITWLCKVQKWGGGTGFDLSKLRAKNTHIASTHGKACGPNAVLKVLSAGSQMITQGGVRDGANMAVMSVHHPDVLDFINLKADENKHLLQASYEYAQIKVDAGEWTKEEGEEHVEYIRKSGLFQLFNVSVAVDREFMRTVHAYVHCSGPSFQPAPTKGGDWIASKPWENKLPCGSTIAEVWDAIVKQAHQSGDPGLLFIDRAQAWSAIQTPLEINATNPCGEQFLPSNGSCNLASIDLAKFVNVPAYEDPLHTEWSNRVDWDELQRWIKVSVRFLDNVVSANSHAMPEITDLNLKERRLGFGVMGWADFLLKIGVPYDSQKAIEIADELASFFREEAHAASYDLAEVRGAFPLWKDIKDVELDIEAAGPHANLDYFLDVPRRNATVTTVAPCGTISIVAGCSSGIEPHFTMAFEHQGLREHGGLGLMWASDTVQELVATVVGAAFNPDDVHRLPEYEKVLREEGWKPANEIDIKWHLAHQGIWQKHIDNSISKTLNLPNEATEQTIAETYLNAWTAGCKGTTVYRDGCKPFQVLNAPKPQEMLTHTLDTHDLAEVEHIGSGEGGQPESEAKIEHLATARWGERPNYVPGGTHKVETSEGDLLVTINYDERGMPYETIINLGKGGNSSGASCEGMARLISTMLRSGIHPYRIVKQLRGIKSNPHGLGPNKVLSIPDAVGQMLERHMIHNFGPDWAADFGWNGNGHSDEETPTASNRIVQYEACPECGCQLALEEGCKKCYACGHSACS